MLQFISNLNGTRIGTLLQTLLYISGVPLFQDNTTILNSNGVFARSSAAGFRNLEVEGPHPDDPLNTRCYGVLGCVTVKYPEMRGFHLFPDPLHDIKPQICLYTSEAPNTCQEVEPDSINKFNLNLTNFEDSYWIVHGYIENSHRPWLSTMKNELLRRNGGNGISISNRNAHQGGADGNESGSNVFVIDWSRGAEPPYTQAVANLELVAAYIAHLMLLLQDTNTLKINKIHFIGHSLGAHFAGFVGVWLQKHADQEIGRITGLDPAQPYFQNYPADARLDSSDATFVDVIHTDGKPVISAGLGTQQPSGHIDFYPNSGRDQPGCRDGVYKSILQEDGSLLSGLRRYLGCDHIRSIEYFTESIRGSCAFTNYACSSWNSFISSSCNFTSASAQRNQMGFHAQKPQGYSNIPQFWTDGFNETKPAQESVLYYSITGSASPFCLHHYQVTLNVDGLDNMRTSPDLKIFLFYPSPKRLWSTTSSSMKQLNIGKRNLRESVKFTIAGPVLPTPLDRIVLKHTSHTSIWWLVNHRNRTDDLNIRSISILSLENSVETVLCPEGRSYLAFNEKDPSVVLTTGACVN